MERKAIDREKLTVYLLGKLPEEEHDAIAEQYFIDDELFDRLLEVKSDLIDRYVRGQLPAEDRPRLESYLNKQPDGWHEVAVARALTSIIDEEEAVEKPEATRPAVATQASEAVGWRQWLAAWLAQPSTAWAVAILLITVGGLLAWLIPHNRRLSHSNQQLLAQMRERDALHEQSSREAEGRLTETQAEAAQLRQELERERQLRESLPPIPSPAVALPLISWPLSFTGLRAPGQPSETVRLDPKAKTIALTIPTRGGQKYTGYEVELKTEDGRHILWKDNQPYTPPIQRGQNIVFHRPAKDFTEASYKLTLTLISAREAKTRDYYFTVARQ
jgi:hypothetical protein